MAEHPMQPPPELVSKLRTRHANPCVDVPALVADAYAAGADAQLERDVEWLQKGGSTVAYQMGCELLAAMRQKLLSLKQQALDVLDYEPRIDSPHPTLLLGPNSIDIIRRALEALPDD